MKKLLIAICIVLCGMMSLEAQNPVFRGMWGAKNDSIQLNLNVNLYSETVMTPDGRRCKGLLEVIQNDSVVSSLMIRSADVEANKASVIFYDSKDNALYQAMFIVNKDNRSIRMVDFKAQSKMERGIVLPEGVDLYKIFK